MSLGSRIKERREQLNLSRNELAETIGVTPSAIANYENEISSPKIELMYKLFNALRCDANYLHQDDMNALVYENTATPEEFENLVKKYRVLDAHGKKMVDFTLNEEWERSQALKNDIKIESTEFSAEIVPIKEHLIPNAAHYRTDIDTSDIPEDADDKYFDE